MLHDEIDHMYKQDKEVLIQSKLNVIIKNEIIKEVFISIYFIKLVIVITNHFIFISVGHQLWFMQLHFLVLEINRIYCNVNISSICIKQARTYLKVENHISYFILNNQSKLQMDT